MPGGIYSLSIHVHVFLLLYYEIWLIRATLHRPLDLFGTAKIHEEPSCRRQLFVEGAAAKSTGRGGTLGVKHGWATPDQKGSGVLLPEG